MANRHSSNSPHHNGQQQNNNGNSNNSGSGSNNNNNNQRRGESPVQKENITTSMRATPAKSTRSHDHHSTSVDDLVHQAKDAVKGKAQQVRGKIQDVSDDTGLALPKLTTVLLIGLLVALGAFYLADLGAHKAVSAFERHDPYEIKPFYKKAAHRVRHAVRRANPFYRAPKHFTIVDWFEQDKDESYVDKIDRTLREYLHTAERLAGFEPAQPKSLWGRAKNSVSDGLDAAKDKATDGLDAVKDKASDSYDAVRDKASDSYEALSERYHTLKDFLTEKGVELNDTKNDLRGKADTTLHQAAKKKREYEHKMNSAWNDYVTKNTDKFKRTARLAQKEAELKSRIVARKAGSIKDRVRGAVSDVADEASDRYNSAKGYAKDMKNRVQHGVKEAKNSADEGIEEAKDYAHDAKHHVKRAGSHARDVAEDAYEEGVDKAHGLRNKVHHKAGLWKERAKEFTESWFGKNQQVRLVEEAQDRLEDLEEKLERQRWRLEWLKKNHIEA